MIFKEKVLFPSLSYNNTSHCVYPSPGFEFYFLTPTTNLPCLAILRGVQGVGCEMLSLILEPQTYQLGLCFAHVVTIH